MLLAPTTDTLPQKHHRTVVVFEKFTARGKCSNSNDRWAKYDNRLVWNLCDLLFARKHFVSYANRHRIEKRTCACKPNVAYFYRIKSRRIPGPTVQTSGPRVLAIDDVLVSPKGKLMPVIYHAPGTSAGLRCEKHLTNHDGMLV